MLVTKITHFYAVLCTESLSLLCGLPKIHLSVLCKAMQNNLMGTLFIPIKHNLSLSEELKGKGQGRTGRRGKSEGKE